MGELSPIHWLIVLAIIVLLFGGKKIPEVMRGLGEGINAFKQGMRGPDGTTPSQTTQTSPPPATASTAAAPTANPVIVEKK
jgi:sec-independent protein translocase protein TatA